MLKLSFACSAICLVSLALCSPVTISEDGGYSIVVAIGQNVDEAPELLDNLKELFTSASSFLYNATRQRTYFEKVTLAIPPSWSRKGEYETSLGDQFQDAHFRVDTAHEEYDDEPYTEHHEGCGRPGRYVHLTPNYLSTLGEPAIVEEFGFPERRIVHEWAHFRYGVFDEKPYGKHPDIKPFYRDNGKLLPTTCMSEVSDMGISVDHSGQVCQPTDEDPKDCVFRSSSEYVTSRASIMFSTSIQSVCDFDLTLLQFWMDGFCDDTLERKHNPLAPNQHNILCKYKSTWDVIFSHSDFKNIRPPSHVVTTPRFRLVRSTGGNGKFVLLLDISGSMEGDPIHLLHETASFVVTHKAAEGSFLGIVAFGTRASVLQPMTKVTSATRPLLQAKLPKLGDGGGTGIGRGLMAAVGVLRGSEGADPVEGGVIVLITDGEETEKPSIEDILPALVTAKVVVHVIAYGGGASLKMETLAQSTGGRLTLYNNIHDVKADNVQLISKLAEAVTLHSDIELEPVKVMSDSAQLSNSETAIPLILDEELGRNTEFTFSASDLSHVAIELSTPSKRVVNWQSPEYRVIANKMIIFTFKDAETGQYNATVLLSADINLSLNFALESQVKDPKKKPILVHTWIDGSEVVFPARPRIYAQVTKGNSPVIKANVTADILGPDSKTTVQLKDDGAFPDILPDDGVYSGFTNGINGNFRYQVVSYVRSSKKTKLRRRNRQKFQIGKRRRRFIDEEEEEEEADEEEDDYETVPVGAFERVAAAGVFKVQGWSEDLGDIQAPSTVSDLTVISVQDGTVTLEWTSPGDDLTSGNATWLDLRGSPHFTEILTNYENLFKINDSFVINGTLVPVSAGKKQSVVLLVPNEFRELGPLDNGTSPSELAQTYFFALRALDEVNNTGDLSNIVQAVFLDEVMESSSTVGSTVGLDVANNATYASGSGDSEAREVKEQSKSVLVIGIILVVVFLVAIVFAVAYYVRKKSRLYTVVAINENA